MNTKPQNTKPQNTSRPLISAICLTRYPQRADMLVESLHSYELQTYPHKELVIVNDGEPLVPVAAGVTVVNLPNQESIGAKRNAGMIAARGEFFAPWDDDDFSMPERLELQLAQVCHDGVVLVRSPLIWIATVDLRVHGLFRGTNYQSSLIRRDEAASVGGYPSTNYGEDFELDLRLRIRGFKISHTAEIFYVHRRHTMNVTNPHGGNDRAFKKMFPSPDTDRINTRLAALRALPRGTLVVPLHHGSTTPDRSTIPERVPVPPASPAGWSGR